MNSELNSLSDRARSALLGGSSATQLLNWQLARSTSARAELPFRNGVDARSSVEFRRLGILNLTARSTGRLRDISPTHGLPRHRRARRRITDHNFIDLVVRRVAMVLVYLEILARNCRSGAETPPT